MDYRKNRDALYLAIQEELRKPVEQRLSVQEMAAKFRVDSNSIYSAIKRLDKAKLSSPAINDAFRKQDQTPNPQGTALNEAPKRHVLRPVSKLVQTPPLDLNLAIEQILRRPLGFKITEIQVHDSSRAPTKLLSLLPQKLTDLKEAILMVGACRMYGLDSDVSKKICALANVNIWELKLFSNELQNSNVTDALMLEENASFIKESKKQLEELEEQRKDYEIQLAASQVLNRGTEEKLQQALAENEALREQIASLKALKDENNKLKKKFQAIAAMLYDDLMDQDAAYDDDENDGEEEGYAENEELSSDVEQELSAQVKGAKAASASRTKKSSSTQKSAQSTTTAKRATKAQISPVLTELNGETEEDGEVKAEAAEAKESVVVKKTRAKATTTKRATKASAKSTTTTKATRVSRARTKATK